MKSFFLSLVFSGIFFFGNSVSASTWCGDYSAPYDLPATFSGTTYSDFYAICQIDGNWKTVYTNPNLELSGSLSPFLFYYNGHNSVFDYSNPHYVFHNSGGILFEGFYPESTIPSDFCFSAQDGNIITTISLMTNDVPLTPAHHGDKNCLSGNYSTFSTFVFPNFSSGPSFSLEVVSPFLDEYHSAKVSPDPRFYVKLSYAFDWDYSDVRFWWYQCPDYEHCDSSTLTLDNLVGSDLISSIRSSLGSSENGFIYVSVPVSLGNHTLLYFKLTTESDTTNRTLATADLLGSGDSGLPSATDAISGSYQDIPNILTNPSGFVSALMANFTVWVRSMFVPSPVFFSSRFGAIEATAEEHFPIFFSIGAIINGSTALNSSVTIGSLDFGGSSTAPLAFFSPGSWNPDTFAGFRSFLSMLMYVWLAYFVTTKLSRIFSS